MENITPELREKFEDIGIESNSYDEALFTAYTLGKQERDAEIELLNSIISAQYDNAMSMSETNAALLRRLTCISSI